MTDTPAQHEEVRVAPYDAIVDAYNLTILQDVGDWSLENGDLAMTKDGDIKVGDAAYNGLFRLVQIWRFSEAHLQYLFATMNKMLAWRERLDDNMNALGEERLARFNPERPSDLIRIFQQHSTTFATSKLRPRLERASMLVL
jgi:hypothetical protein